MEQFFCRPPVTAWALAKGEQMLMAVVGPQLLPPLSYDNNREHLFPVCGFSHSFWLELVIVFTYFEVREMGSCRVQLNLEEPPLSLIFFWR